MNFLCFRNGENLGKYDGDKSIAGLKKHIKKMRKVDGKKDDGKKVDGKKDAKKAKSKPSLEL